MAQGKARSRKCRCICSYAYGDTAPYAHGVCQRSGLIHQHIRYRLRTLCRFLALLFTPTYPSCPVRPSAPAYAFRPRPAHHRSSPTAPTSGEIGAAAKSISASGILTFTAAISPHIGSVGSAYNATKNEVGAVGEMRAVGGLERRTRGAAPYPVIAYKSIF